MTAAVDSLRGASPGAGPSAIERRAAHRLAGLDWIRGAASMWVLFYHVDITLQKAKYFGLPALSLVSSVGYRGVELFFLLSGFVMARTYSVHKAGSWTEANAFVVRRLLRIFPAYLVVFLPLFAVAAWKGVGAPPDVPVDLRLFLQNLLLLPRDDLTTFIPVSAWTLTHELMFYALFVVSFLSWRAFLVLLVVWGTGSVALYLGGVQLQGWAMPASALNAYFLLGLGCALVRRDIPRGWGRAFAGGTLLCLGAAIGLEARHPGAATAGFYAMQVAYAASFVLIVFGLSRPGVCMPAGFERVASYFGRISYGLYLVNYPVVVVVAMVARASGLQAHVTLLVAAAAAGVSILMADLLYRFVERPTVTYGKNLFRKTL